MSLPGDIQLLFLSAQGSKGLSGKRPSAQTPDAPGALGEPPAHDDLNASQSRIPIRGRQKLKMLIISYHHNSSLVLDTLSSVVVGYWILQIEGFLQWNWPSGQSMLNVSRSSKPIISRSSCMRNVKVDSGLPIKYLLRRIMLIVYSLVTPRYLNCLKSESYLACEQMIWSTIATPPSLSLSSISLSGMNFFTSMFLTSR